MKPFWLQNAVMELGEKEIRGPEDNPRIVEYHADTSLHAKDDETAWCSAFVNWVMNECGIKGTNKANARSWLDWGSSCTLTLGAVVIFWRNDPNSWQGHVGFVVGFDSDWIYVLGGNQGNKVSVAKYPRSKMLGCRWPKL